LLQNIFEKNRSKKTKKDKKHLFPSLSAGKKVYRKKGYKGFLHKNFFTFVETKLATKIHIFYKSAASSRLSAFNMNISAGSGKSDEF